VKSSDVYRMLATPKGIGCLSGTRHPSEQQRVRAIVRRPSILAKHVLLFFKGWYACSPWLEGASVSNYIVFASHGVNSFVPGVLPLDACLIFPSLERTR
jgi:hypothetical protein